MRISVSGPSADWPSPNHAQALVTPMVSVPPYWPTSSSGVITTGSGGSRSSTGGSSPAATLAANIGASL